MPVSFSGLHLADPSPQARRLLWNVLSVGRVWRDEPEHHAGADKAGLHLFWVVRGSGLLVTGDQRRAISPGYGCWLVDLRQPRSYLPDEGRRLETAGIRFHGLALEAWREALGDDVAFAFQEEREFAALRRAQRLLLRLVRQRPPDWEWRAHETINEVLGRLAAARSLFQAAPAKEPEAVRRVLEAVFAQPDRDWQAAALAKIAGVSYSRLRDVFKASRSETLHDFLQRTRLDEARRLLGDPTLTIKEVAARLHFSSEFYFSHFFHKASGMSPTQFRREPQG
jgi:AraC-like DNA-binding protein